MLKIACLNCLQSCQRFFLAKLAQVNHKALQILMPNRNLLDTAEAAVPAAMRRSGYFPENKCVPVAYAEPELKFTRDTGAGLQAGEFY